MKSQGYDEMRYSLKYDLTLRRFKLEKHGKLSQNEKDWFNLMQMRLDIGYMSIDYRLGCISTLERAIKKLEKEMSREEKRRVHKGEVER